MRLPSVLYSVHYIYYTSLRLVLLQQLMPATGSTAHAWSTYSESFRRKAQESTSRSDESRYTSDRGGGMKFVRQNSERDCFSCMSRQYLLSWHELVYHYYPPKSFTDACADPHQFRGNVTTERCKHACITVTENVAIGDRPWYRRSNGVQISKRYMRGCIDRFLLFNMGRELRREMAAVGPHELCRVINRQMMHLYNPDASRHFPADHPKPEIDQQKDMIEVCSCLADKCNGSPSAGSNAHGRAPSTQLLALCGARTDGVVVLGCVALLAHLIGVWALR